MTTSKSRKRAVQTTFRSIEEFKRRYFPSVVSPEREQEGEIISLGISGERSAEALRQLTASLTEPKNNDAGESRV
ncbi:MAG TPA: hypothetical protein VHG08_02785 [Longimicrobium sp.]|nr:hypothetical protein [Longimicrobium sp.]